MGKAGKRPEIEVATDANQVDVDASVAKWPAPQHLPKEAKECWEHVISALPASHFRSCDLPILEKFCWAEYLFILATKELDKNGLIIETGLPTISPAVKIMREQSALQASLGTKLRLNPSSRMTPREAANEEDEGVKDGLDDLMYRE